jgi:hypothetical protein
MAHGTELAENQEARQLLLKLLRGESVLKIEETRRDHRVKGHENQNFLVSSLRTSPALQTTS